MEVEAGEYQLDRACAPSNFVEVTEQFAAPAIAEAGVIELDVGGTRIRVRGRVESEALARVLDALEGRR